MKIRHTHAEDLGFQIAPMCDVLLVLLVFFITITSTSSLRSDRDIKLPVSAHAAKKETARSETVLNVKWVTAGKSRGVVAMEGNILEELTGLTDVLAGRFKKDPTYRVVVRADKKTPAEFVEKVMGACAAAGISDISFAVLNRE